MREHQIYLKGSDPDRCVHISFNFNSVKTLSENLKNIEDAEREQRWDATNQLQGLGVISEFEANK